MIIWKEGWTVTTCSNNFLFFLGTSQLKRRLHKKNTLRHHYLKTRVFEQITGMSCFQPFLKKKTNVKTFLGNFRFHNFSLYLKKNINFKSRDLSLKFQVGLGIHGEPGLRVKATSSTTAKDWDRGKKLGVWIPYIWLKLMVNEGPGGGNSIMFYFHPESWRNDPI